MNEKAEYQKYGNQLVKIGKNRKREGEKATLERKEIKIQRRDRRAT